jgi:hypothetical protein
MRRLDAIERVTDCKGETNADTVPFTPTREMVDICENT